MIAVEFRAFGYDYREDDRRVLNDVFSDIGFVRADGQWAPAAGPPIDLIVVLTFFGQALATVVLGKVLESTWEKFRIAWKSYKNARQGYSSREPEMGSIRIRTSDLDIQINMPVNPEEFDLNTFMELVVDRLSSASMPDGIIHQLSLPSRKEEDGHWERVSPEEYCEDDDQMVWWMQGSSVDGPWFFYNAEEDRILRRE